MKKIISYLTGLIIFIGLPVIVWGIKDVKLFFENPYRLVYVILMAMASLFVILFVPNEGKGYGEGNKTIKRQKLAIILIQIVTMLIVILSPLFDRHQTGSFSNQNLFRASGLGLTFFGFFLMNYSIMILGKQFSIEVTIQEGHQLITKGPYRFIRHPRYLGVICQFSGIPLLFNSWVALLLIIPLIAVLLWRIRDEETILSEEFQKEWLQYKKRSWFLIPFIF